MLRRGPVPGLPAAPRFRRFASLVAGLALVVAGFPGAPGAEEADAGFRAIPPIAAPPAAARPAAASPSTAPDLPHAADLVLAGPTLTEAAFTARLKAVHSPARASAHVIYRALVDNGVNPAFALATFQAESSSGTRGYAATTRNWGNILYHSWQAAFGAVPYAPGNGYTYAKFPTWLAGVQAYVQLLGWYQESGYETVSAASAHWLGTALGSSRHTAYLTNISKVMVALPLDAVPVMTRLSAPSASRANVKLTLGATDDEAVTGYQVQTRLGAGPWSPASTVSGPTPKLTLPSGTWTVGARATDVYGNWSPWTTTSLTVDADAPTMTKLGAPAIVRTRDGAFTAGWSGTDAVGVARYQYRTRRTNATAWSAAHGTTATSAKLALASGSWYLDVRAADAVGNWSAWRETPVVVPVDDRAHSFSSGTVRLRNGLDYRGTATATNRAGARMKLTLTGTGFSLVGRSGPTYGQLRITIDGKAYVVDTGKYKGKRATVTHHAVVLFSRTLRAGHHTIAITNLATAHRPTIVIDGLGFVR